MSDTAEQMPTRAPNPQLTTINTGQNTKKATIRVACGGSCL